MNTREKQDSVWRFLQEYKVLQRVIGWGILYLIISAIEYPEYFIKGLLGNFGN